jgi:hypothetical protein
MGSDLIAWVLAITLGVAVVGLGLRRNLSDLTPFSGSGRFNRVAKRANRWSGDLTVDLPGRAGVELTGSGDRAKLAHVHWDFHPNSSSKSR